LSLTCSKGLWQDDLGAHYAALGDKAVPGAWIVVDRDEKMYLRWRDETILMLSKISNGQPIEASFPCSNASTATEHAICNSHQLSAFDQSIAESYQRAVTQAKVSRARAATLGSSQRRWIKERDACGSNSACVLKSMRARLKALAAVASGS
jgi:uncharacterized protein YecT (DUF1311 family)